MTGISEEIMDSSSAQNSKEEDVSEIEEWSDLTAWVLATLRCMHPDADISSTSIMVRS